MSLMVAPEQPSTRHALQLQPEKVDGGDVRKCCKGSWKLENHDSVMDKVADNEYYDS